MTILKRASLFSSIRQLRKEMERKKLLFCHELNSKKFNKTISPSPFISLTSLYLCFFSVFLDPVSIYLLLLLCHYQSQFSFSVCCLYMSPFDVLSLSISSLCLSVSVLISFFSDSWIQYLCLSFNFFLSYCFSLVYPSVSLTISFFSPFISYCFFPLCLCASVTISFFSYYLSTVSLLYAYLLW